MAAINKVVFVFFGLIAIVAIVNSAPPDTKNVNIFQRVRRSPQIPEPPNIPMPPQMPLENGQRVARQAPSDGPQQARFDGPQQEQGRPQGPPAAQNMEHQQNRFRREAKGGGHMPTKTG